MATAAESAAVLEEPQAVTKPARAKAPRATAESMALRQRDISVSEFFAKNRHLLGFDNPRKALLTTVKEAVDNSLDACEEAGILPDITVVMEDLQPDRPASAKQSRYRVTVIDNGPGIVKKQVEHIFGRLLYGSKFHRLKMSRGQQGIGISAAGMYGLITTGKPMVIHTRPDAAEPAHHIELVMNTKTNRAEITEDRKTKDFPPTRLRELSATVREEAAKGTLLSPEHYPTGTCVAIELEGKYQRGRGSVDEFLELTAIANPHARITFVRPTRTTDEEDEPTLIGKKGRKEPGDPAAGDSKPAGADSEASNLKSEIPTTAAITADLGDLVVFPRAVEELPPETKEIQPHPRGVELGSLLQMLKDFQESDKGGTLYNFLQDRFCRISAASASALCEKIGLTSRTRVADVEPAQAEALFKAFQETKFGPPPTDCLAPIGVQQLLKGMFKGVRAEFYAASSRETDIYRGRPFLIEVAVAFGGELPVDDTARVIRFANRVPLLFQQSACSSFKAVVETNWRNYDLQHPRNALPIGPLVIMIHMASVWVPFTSESKEAIADYDEIRKEMKLALMECGRKLGTYLRKRARMKREGERRDIFERYIGEIAQAVNAINGTDAKRLFEALKTQAKRRTAIADLQLDEEGKAVKEDPADQEGVIIVDPSATAPAPPGPEPGGAKGSVASKAGPGAKAAAELKRKSRGKSDEPALLDTAPTRGKTKPSAKKRSPEPAAPSPPPAATASTPAKKPKPKMRLVNGKLVPVDDGPGLF